MKRKFKTEGQKTLTALALLLTLASTPLSAAENTTTAKALSGVKIVPSLGYTYFNIQGTDLDLKSKGGSSAAVLAQVKMMDQLDLETGLQYIETGAKMSVDFGFLSFDTAQFEISNIAIPLLAKYSFNSPQAQEVGFYGKAGLIPMYAVQAKLKTLTETTDIKSDINAFTALTQVAVGGDWDSMGGRINLDVSYNYGLTEFSKSLGGRTAGYQILAGYTIQL